MPEISPEEGLIARPAGRPVADQVSVSPSGSDAGADSDTAAPSASVRFPNPPPNTGGRLVSVTAQRKDAPPDSTGTPSSVAVTVTPYGEPVEAV